MLLSSPDIHNLKIMDRHVTRRKNSVLPRSLRSKVIDGDSVSIMVSLLNILAPGAYIDAKILRPS